MRPRRSRVAAPLSVPARDGRQRQPHRRSLRRCDKDSLVSAPSPRERGGVRGKLSDVSIHIIPRTLRRLSLLASLLAAVLLSACASKQVQLRMALQVVSQPEKAQVRYRGKTIGEAPTDVDVRTYEDLEAIVATLNGMNVVEKRL